MAGPALGDRDPAAALELSQIVRDSDPPTDDWPYLYLTSPGISGFYLSVIALILVLSAAVVFGVSPELRRHARIRRMAPRGRSR